MAPDDLPRRLLDAVPDDEELHAPSWSSALASACGRSET